MTIAILYTCFNRKDKTISSLRGLFSAVEYYNKFSEAPIHPSIFLTDDGCTDGTSEAIVLMYPDKDITIIKGSGSLFWAGGMIAAWQEAMSKDTQWDYYLLLNDDTIMFQSCIQELMNTHLFCKRHYNRVGIYSGLTCATSNLNSITYGGRIITNSFLGTSMQVKKTGMPQMIDLTNANILMVPNSIVEEIGILYSGYRHGNADFDYSMQARKRGIPVLVTENVCGMCDCDHKSGQELKEHLLSMSIKERKEYFSSPLHSSKDYLLFIKRNFPLKYPLSWLFRKLHERFPNIYYLFKP